MHSPESGLHQLLSTNIRGLVPNFITKSSKTSIVGLPKTYDSSEKTSKKITADIYGRSFENKDWILVSHTPRGIMK